MWGTPGVAGIEVGVLGSDQRQSRWAESSFSGLRHGSAGIVGRIVPQHPQQLLKQEQLVFCGRESRRR